MSVQSEIDRLRQAVSDAFTAIGNKGGTVPSSKVSGNLATAIQSIPEGVTVQIANGSVTTNNSGTATISCGFQPDLIVFTSNFLEEFAVSFYGKSVGAVAYPLTWGNTEGEFAECGVTLNRTGATLSYLTLYGTNWSETIQKNKVLNYTAIKFT